MSSNWGKNLQISIFGESHGKAIGVVIDGLPSGMLIRKNEVLAMMERRAPGKNSYSTKRKEPDRIEVLSGIYNGYTTGTPLTGIVSNEDTRSTDYQNLPLRPSHADFTGNKRYSGYNDPRGSGHFSARLTAPFVFAGAIAKEILRNQFNITIGAHIKRIYNILDDCPNPVSVTAKELLTITQKDFPVLNDEQGVLMQELIERIITKQDSLGGIVSCYCVGVPAGIGSPMFDGIENKLASIIWGIPGVRGLEFGAGFEAAHMRGSEHNDPYSIQNGAITTTTNHHGGIIGGITSGMPIIAHVAFKPTPSIAREQTSILLENMEETILQIHGRHDPCIVPRAVPVVEAAMALGILDAMLEGGNPNVTWTIPPAN